MGFRLAPKSMILDDLELDGGQLPLFSLFRYMYLNLHNSGCIQHRDMMFGSRVGFSDHMCSQLKRLNKV